MRIDPVGCMILTRPSEVDCKATTWFAPPLLEQNQLVAHHFQKEGENAPRLTKNLLLRLDCTIVFLVVLRAEAG